MEKNNLGKMLFREYGISEWDEKCVLLSPNEEMSILHTLRHGGSNTLSDVIKLPYPQFVTEYIKLYKDKLNERSLRISGLHEYLMQAEDCYYDLGYKLYVMPIKLVKIIVDYIKNPHMDISQIISHRYYDTSIIDVIMFLNQPLDESFKIVGAQNYNKDAIKKYIHIMSYVDANEARKLKLDNFTFKKNDMYRGFDMEEKLNALNPLIRYIVEENLGFNGEYVPLYEISDKLNLTLTLNSLLTDSFYLALTKSIGEFKNYLKLIDREYSFDERREYAVNSPYRLLADKIEVNFIRNYLKSIGENIPEVDNKSRKSFDYLSAVYSAQIGTEIPIKKM